MKLYKCILHLSLVMTHYYKQKYVCLSVNFALIFDDTFAYSCFRKYFKTGSKICWWGKQFCDLQQLQWYRSTEQRNKPTAAKWWIVFGGQKQWIFTSYVDMMWCCPCDLHHCDIMWLDVVTVTYIMECLRDLLCDTDLHCMILLSLWRT